MAFFTRPHFEDRQFVQYVGESITLSGNTELNSQAQLIVGPTNLQDGTGTTITGPITVSGLYGELSNLSRVSGLVVKPPVLYLLDTSGNTTGSTTIDVTGYVLTSYDSGGTATWDTVASLSADTNTYTVDGTLLGEVVYFDTNTTLSAYTTNLSGLTFNGGSGSCITDLYVTNLYGCSPITINDTLNFNVSGSTFFTDTNTNLDIGIDEDAINGDLFKIYFGTSYFGIRNTGSTNTVESVFFGNDSLGDVLKVTTDGIVVEQEITSTIYDMGTISGSTSLDIRNGNLQTLTLNGNLTLNALSASTTEGGFLTVYVSQDGVGGHTLTKGTNILTESGAAISITSGASTKDTLTFKTDNNGDYRLDNHTKDFS